MRETLSRTVSPLGGHLMSKRLVLEEVNSGLVCLSSKCDGRKRLTFCSQLLLPMSLLGF